MTSSISAMSGRESGMSSLVVGVLCANRESDERVLERVDEDGEVAWINLAVSREIFEVRILSANGPCNLEMVDGEISP
jgi:hypothetical protein